MYCIGIDLGTTNCAMAFADPDKPGEAIADFHVLQLVRPGEVAGRPLLPSFIYVPGPELPASLLRLPWEPKHPLAVGELARWQGARVPGRLVSSAKSWLCHSGVDRAAAILPWGSPDEVTKISPVEASSMLLSHLAEAWADAHPEARLAQQEVAITVPASFDEVARALTVEAARRAGFEKLTLLEEPQAAFYDYSARHSADLARVLEGIRLVLVVDVGGGTTDFTQLQVGASPEGPVLRRIAVGDHLMLGGDNMDAALARCAEDKLGGRKLGAAQWTQLTMAAREAKEALLSAGGPERHLLTLAASGSRLVSGVLSTELTGPEVRQLVLDGFFPRSLTGEEPQRGARMALQELSLPYAQDPAITRHLSAFLRAHAGAGFAALEQKADSGGLPRPDAVLLNGGVFNSPQIAERLLEVVSSWWPSAPPIRLLKHGSLDLAVARGAAHYGLVRRGLGRRIGGGAARAFYVGLEAQGDRGEELAVCLIPRGFQEGESIELGQRSFSLTLGRPVQFPLYSTSSDRIDRPGDLVPVSEDFRPLPPIHTILEGAKAKTGALPVHLRASLTELGTLELWCVSDRSDERWRLEFELRGGGSAGHLMAVVESMPARFGEAREWVERFFGHRPLPVGPKDVKQLGRHLEKVLGPRENWRVPVLREIWSALYAGAAKRRRSPEHERVFFSLLGYSLRPGFGYPLDQWRSQQTFQLFPQGVEFHGEKSVWTEFWILWRRASGGLSEEDQLSLWSYLKPHLARRVRSDSAPAVKVKGVQPEGLDEMVRTAASLEHLGAREKAELGGWIAERLQSSPGGGPWAWALGRIGARVPLYGSGHRAVAHEQAAQWVRLLVELGIQRIDGAAFAVAQLARRSGDRTRDLDDQVRSLAVEALTAARAPEAWLRMPREVVVLEAGDEARALGDTLPAGLQLAFSES
jgi:molecular chaperone DnaK (HSP70)